MQGVSDDVAVVDLRSGLRLVTVRPQPGHPVAFQPQSAKAVTGEVDDGPPEVDLEGLGAP